MQLVITFNISYKVKFETDGVFCKSNMILISRKVKDNRVYMLCVVLYEENVNICSESL